MSRHKNLLVALSIALAVIAPMLMALKARGEMQSWPVVKVEIEPYDPRDLLYGHYMTFAYKWNWDKERHDAKACQGADCCLCLDGGAEDPKASVMACNSDKPQYCAHALKGAFYGDRFDIGLNRYYVDESIALPLENLFRNKKEKFHVGLSINPKGKPVLEKLYVGAQPVNDYVADHYEELTKPVQPQDAP